ncbi:MAG: NUDIX domain-containing protein [Nanoarchaeota archaeon]
MGLIPVVGENDEVIGYRERSVPSSDFVRVSALWITNSKGETLIAQRAHNRSSLAGLWGPSAAGTVEKGEDYLSNILKEAEEEIGLKDIQPRKGPKLRVSGEKHFFFQIYYLRLDQPVEAFTLQKEEVAAVRWVSKEALLKEVRENPASFTPSVKWYLEPSDRVIDGLNFMLVSTARIPVVDEEDKVIGYKTREEIQPEDVYRISQLWMTNTKGDVLLARRALTKVNSPGKWGGTADGTVEEGESYETNILKEAEEEIGLKNIWPKLGKKRRITSEKNFFCQTFLLTLDKSIEEFKLQSEEVAEVKWFSKEELRRELQTNPDAFTLSTKMYVEWFLSGEEL